MEVSKHEGAADNPPDDEGFDKLVFPCVYLQSFPTLFEGISPFLSPCGGHICFLFCGLKSKYSQHTTIDSVVFRQEETNDWGGFAGVRKGQYTTPNQPRPKTYSQLSEHLKIEMTPHNGITWLFCLQGRIKNLTEDLITISFYYIDRRNKANFPSFHLGEWYIFRENRLE